jgi:hypothetical protein
MKRNATNTLGSVSQMTSHLIRGGRRTGFAIALVIVMAVMWIRVFTGQKPRAAEARPDGTPPTDEPQKQPPTVRLVDLPLEPGRNDRIHRDFFTTQDWSRFSSVSKPQSTGSETEVQTVASKRTNDVIEKLAKTLRLEAVLWSADPQAFVNDRLVRLGDTIALSDGSDAYVFEVVQIKEDAVLVTCRDRQWTLKLSSPADVRK